jgi:hypothetical protein
MERPNGSAASNLRRRNRMITQQVTLPTVSVPKLAEIVRRLGGFDAIEPSNSYCINLDRKQIYRPQDHRNDYDEDGNRVAEYFEFFPDIDGEGYRWPTLIITLFWRNETYQVVLVGLGAKVNGDIFHESEWKFHVPFQGWESGQWQIYSLSSQVPFMFGIHQRSQDGEEVARELVADCEGFDRESLLLNSCLRIVRDAFPESY